MATKKYPPRDDEGLLDSGQQFEDNVGTPGEIGLNDADIARLSTANTQGQAAFAANKAAQSAATTATTEKDGKLDVIDDILSEFNSRTQRHPGMTNAKREALGLPIYDAVKTKAPAPTEAPNVSIDTSTSLLHTIMFSGEGKKGKPEGVKELEIYQKIGGDATGNVDDYKYRGRDTDPPYTWNFDAADSGKQAHYMFCWLNSAGERGPWKMASATITSELQSITN